MSPASVSSPATCPVAAAHGPARSSGVLRDDRYGSPGEFSMFRCDTCGHRWLGPEAAALDPEVLYATYYPRGGAPASVSGFPLPRVVARLPLVRSGEVWPWVPRGSRVLDVGCGTGELLEALRRHGCRAQGVEVDPVAAAVARRRGFEVTPGAFEPARWPARSLDAIVFNQVLEHLPAPGAILAGARRLLAPGGRIVVSTPDSSSPAARVLGDAWIHWHAPYHLHVFSRASLRAVADGAGLRVTHQVCATPGRWVVFQLQHLVGQVGRPGPSLAWRPELAGRLRRLALRAVGGTRLTGAPQTVTRVLDVLGAGDNMLAVLESGPEDP